MRILIVDNTLDQDCWGSANLARFAAKAPGATVQVRRAPHEDLPKDLTRFDRVILSGSGTSATEDAPWISKLHDLIRTTIQERKPLLGVCYGHQSLVRALGGKEFVRKGQTPEVGWTRVEVLEKNALFEGLPNTFYSFSMHYDEVCQLPKGMKNLARSADCSIQAFQLEDHPVFGIQFHPEKNREEALKTFAEKKKKGEPKRLLHPNDTDRLFDPKVGDTLFQNFFKL